MTGSIPAGGTAALPALRIAAALCLAAAFCAGAAAQQAGMPFGASGAHDASLPVEITSESLSVDQAAGTAVFTGAVVVGQGVLRLGAEAVKVFYADGADGGVERIVASGGVTVTNGAEAAEGAQALYRVADGTIEMDGDVILTQGSNAVAGERLRIDLAAGRAVIEGRVQTIIVPEAAPEAAPGRAP